MIHVLDARAVPELIRGDPSSRANPTRWRGPLSETEQLERQTLSGSQERDSGIPPIFRKGKKTRV